MAALAIFYNRLESKRVKDKMFASKDKQGDAFVAGLFGVDIALAQKDRSQQVPMPLKNISYLVQICEGIAEINTAQTYLNNTSQFLEVCYKFPISTVACLHRFVATFSETHLFGVVKQKKQAQKECDAAVKEGKRVVYGQIKQERKDVMAIKIGNIGPGVEVKIEISYIEELRVTINTFYAFSLQTKIFSRINYLINLHKQQSQLNFLLKVKSSRKIIKYNVLSQNLKINSYNKEDTELSFILDENSINKSSINFIYTTQSFQLPTFVVGNTDESTTVMVSFIPKFCQLNLGDAEKAAIQNKALEVNFDNVKGQYIFLMDRSSSMKGNSIKKAKRALIIFLKSLPIDSFFNVYSFGSTYMHLFPFSQKNNNKGMAKAIKQIEKMEADMGGTEIQEPLKHIFSGKTIENYPRQIFLLTDGAVGDTQSVVNLVKKNTKFSRVNTIGFGAGASRDLIQGCAKSGKGLHVYIDDRQDPAQKIIQLLTESFSEVITSVKLHFDKTIVKSIAPNPQSISYILKGQVVNFYITFNGRLDKMTYIQLSYQDSLNKLTFTSGTTIQPQQQSFPFIDKMGHFRVIKQLEDSIIENGIVQDRLYYAKPADKEQQIVNLSIKNQILSKYTAFLCVEKQLIDGRFEEIQEKGKIKWLSQQAWQDHSKIIRVSASQLVGDANLNLLMARGSRGRGRGRGADRRRSRSHSFERERNFRKRNRSRDRSIQKKSQKRQNNMRRERQISSSQSSSQSENIKQLPQKREIQACMIQMKPPPIKNKGYSLQLFEQKTNALDKIMKDIVNEQNIEGYWSNLVLLKKIDSYSENNSLPQDKDIQNVAITIIILKWIKQNINTREYTLIVKKANSWLRRQMSFQDLAQKYKYSPQ